MQKYILYFEEVGKLRMQTLGMFHVNIQGVPKEGSANLLKVNRQRPSSVMRRPELKTPTLAKWLMSPLLRVITKICKKSLVLKTKAILIFIMKHEFLYNNSCKPVCTHFSVFKKCQIS